MKCRRIFQFSFLFLFWCPQHMSCCLQRQSSALVLPPSSQPSRKPLPSLSQQEERGERERKEPLSFFLSFAVSRESSAGRQTPERREAEVVSLSLFPPSLFGGLLVCALSVIGPFCWKWKEERGERCLPALFLALAAKAATVLLPSKDGDLTMVQVGVKQVF